ncbi:MAG: FAD-binding domain-containing protein, partial [Elioraea sp.]|nr:FAD-binding domain-containing protein [Elioraea sp.]
YSPLKQAEDQDPEGRFIRRWVPELAGLPAPAAHRPWEFGVRGYPEPIGDASALAARARERLWAVRRGAAYRAVAEAIQARHGSRRSGLRQVGARRPRHRAAEQPALDLEP